MKHNDLEVQWIADGIRALLVGTNGTDKFPEEFYNQVKDMVGWKYE